MQGDPSSLVEYNEWQSVSSGTTVKQLAELPNLNLPTSIDDWLGSRDDLCQLFSLAVGWLSASLRPVFGKIR